MSGRRRGRIAYIYLLLFAFFGALGHPLGRIVVGKVHPFQLGSISLGIGFLCVVLFLSVGRKLRLFLTLPVKTLFCAFGLGIIGFSLFYICSFSALARIPASMNAVLISTTVVFTFLFAALFLGERFTLMKIAGALLAFGGVALVAFNRGLEASGRSVLTGALFSLAGAVVNALYSVFGKKMLRENDPLLLTSLAMLSGAVFLTLFTLLTVGYGGTGEAGARTWLLIILIGVTLFGISYPLFFLAMKVEFEPLKGFKLLESSAPLERNSTMPVTTASLSMYLIPVFAVLLSFALLGERFAWPFYAGFAAILGGIAMSGTGARELRPHKNN